MRIKVEGCQCSIGQGQEEVVGGERERTEAKVSEGKTIEREVVCKVQGQARRSE